MKLNYTQLLNNARKILKANGRDFERYPKGAMALVDLFSQIKVVKEGNKISASKTFQKMKEGYTVKDAEGEIYTSEEVGKALMYAYSVPRGSIIKGSQTKHPTLGALTPLAMYALKDIRGIGYNEWDRKDPSLIYFLGRTYLERLAEPHPKIELDIAETIKLRDEALTVKSGATKGEIRKLITNAMPAKKTINGHSYPRVHLYLLLQTWLANTELRKPEIMILDPWDWDKVPTEIDAGQVGQDLSRSTRQVGGADLDWWDELPF